MFISTVMKKPILFTILLVSVMTSCVSTSFTSIDVRQPAQISLNPTIANVLVVNNTPVKVLDTENNKEAETLPIDSVSMLLSQTLTQYLADEKYFDSVSCYPENVNPTNGRLNPIKRSLSKNEIKSLSEGTGNDAVISIDQVTLSGEISTNPYYRDLIVLSFGISANLDIFDATGELIAKPITYMDTLYWDQAAMMFDPVSPRDMPSLSEALEETIAKTADALAKQFAPYWEKQERWYYAGGSSKLSDGAKLAKVNSWQRASDIWQQNFESEENISRKIRLAFNVALAHEYMDDIDGATLWMDKAYQLTSEASNIDQLNKEVVLYKAILDERKSKVSKLKEQFGSISE